MSNDSGINSLKVFKFSLERVQNLPQQVLVISHVGLELYQLSFVTCIVDCMIVCCVCVFVSERECVF